MVRGIVLQFQRPGLVQLAGGVDFSQNCLGHGRSTSLTAQIPVDGGTILVSFRHDEGRTAGEYQDDVFVDIGHSLDQFLLALGQFHMQPVHALGFQNLIQTHAEQNHFRILCDANCFLDHPRIRLGIFPVKALRIAGDVQSMGSQAVVEIVQLCGVDLTGACPLIPGCFGKVTDDGGFGFLFQGENAVVVQQDDGACGAFFCNGVVGILVKFLGCGGYGFSEGEYLI